MKSAGRTHRDFPLRRSRTQSLKASAINRALPSSGSPLLVTAPICLSESADSSLIASSTAL